MKKSGTAIAVPLLILNVTIMEQYKGRERLCLYLLGVIGIAEKGRKKAPQKILCKRFSTKARISHVCCA